ncbi:related to longevity-assurance protein LAG1 [Cephalotrichum gorgonifer]|uniref:Related to longevity-assurance protein LAG1 n=1 Tax=Cephalotrichum gorgonifer TaxID=2041049 RepID=A0AAE8MNW9_9PEZI|nr:related to longevity-assurance protein LAG1 [Cephalotrichum gorgonifer]
MGTAEISPILDNAIHRPSSKGENGTPRHRTKSGSSARSRPLSKRKPRSLARRIKHIITRHTWSLPLFLLVTAASLYALNPTESNILHRFIFPYYRIDDPSAAPGAPVQYGKGLWDIAFVSFHTIVLSFTREFIMQEILRPLANAWGITSRRKQERFAEQMYTAIYFGISGPVGIYVMRQTPVWYFNTRGMYEAYPHKAHDATFKFYYLFQAAYWAQQAIVMLLGLEKRRKDFKELVGHHIVTLALIALSYRFHFAYIGIAIYLTHDVSDFFLAISKSLHYANSRLVPVSFALCIGWWIYCRHYLNIYILWSLLTDYRTVGPYGMDWDAGQYKGFLSNVITFGLLASLQALNLFWLYCLLRSAYRFVVHKVIKDDRSEESEPEEAVAKEALGDGVATGASTGVKANGTGVAAAPTKRNGAAL